MGRAINNPEAWEQRQLAVFTAMRYTLLAICTIVTLFIGTQRGLVVALSAVTALWLLWWETLHPQWRERPRLMAIEFAGLMVLMAALVILAPWYGFFTFTGYLSVLTLPHGFKPAGILAVAVITGTSQNGGLPATDAGALAIWVVIVAVNACVAGAFMFFGWVDEAQKAKLTEANRRLEESLRENAGLHAQLVTQAREAGVLDERQRMAREIHDTLAQGLTGIITQLEAAAQDGAEAQRHVDAASRLARESLSEARRSVQALQPEPLEAALLPDALAEVAQRWSSLHGVAASVTTTGAPRSLRPEIEGTLLRTAQEALANVAKHADATRVGLTLSYIGDVVSLDVRDDGVGFDPHVRNGHGSAEGGFGLTAMRQRVQSIAGTLEIESEPGGGTAVSASVPAIPAGVR
jgi:signal transduction histidine kinase